MSQSSLPLVSAAPLFTSKCLDSTADAEQLCVLTSLVSIHIRIDVYTHQSLRICFADTAQYARQLPRSGLTFQKV